MTLELSVFAVLLAAGWLGLSPFFLAASRLAFSHGHVFAGPWLLLALRATLASRPRLGAWRASVGSGLLAGFAAGNDLLAGGRGDDTLAQRFFESHDRRTDRVSAPSSSSDRCEGSGWTA